VLLVENALTQIVIISTGDNCQTLLFFQTVEAHRGRLLTCIELPSFRAARNGCVVPLQMHPVRQFAAFSRPDIYGKKIISSFLRPRFLKGLPPFGLFENESRMLHHPGLTPVRGGGV
jgi:hypothetical protein